MLLRLPRELRDMVYVALFASTRLTFGQSHVEQKTTKTIIPALNSLAILRTCHQIHAEAGRLWRHRVLFNFENAEALLDKLSLLAPTALSQIRHLRTSRSSLQFDVPGENPVAYRLVSFLRLLPGLRLDTLTVIECTPWDRRLGFYFRDEMIRYGNG